MNPTPIAAEELEFTTALREAASAFVRLNASKSTEATKELVRQALTQGGSVEVRIQVHPIPIIRIVLEGVDDEAVLATFFG
jgi:hypothetical protein